MNRGGKYMIRTYRCGNVVEKSKFWVSDRVKPRSKKHAATRPRKQDANDRDIEKRLARAINCNFSYGDTWITLSFDKAGMAAIGGDPKQAERQAKLFLRRLAYALGKRDRDFCLKYIGMVSDIDGETGEDARLHVHILLNCMDAPLLRLLWTLGTVDIETLHRQDDYSALAVYLCRQMRRRAKDAKKYFCSRNLKKPEITETISYRKSPLRAPSGTKILSESEFNIESGQHYIRYIELTPKTKKTKIGGHKEGLDPGGKTLDACSKHSLKPSANRTKCSRDGEEEQGSGDELPVNRKASEADFATTT